ncbi:hypothetical protein [Paractinoplanes durhamensis]|uniref:Uncharacterized protein n=1 Tax=Paractinoplanes durhamensis TaxID=113563 RepID=A0ABQ3YTD7_9ACTN|nr:hypothetical protein [Actinoplanes durhamensis]GIE00808.1 hypothetical protein Adu01nite_21580 [Actinoplanes durhamensis]
MNRFTRILTMAGLGLVTGVTMAAGPAMAASSSDQGTAKSGSNASEARRFGDRTVGVFRSYRACDRAGEYGEDRGYWEDYDCVRIFWHGSVGYRLVVDYDDWGHGWGGHFPSNWGGGWRPYPGNWGGGNWGGGNWGGGNWGGGNWGGNWGGPRPGPWGGPGRPPVIIPPGAPLPTLPGTGTPVPPGPVSVQS